MKRFSYFLVTALLGCLVVLNSCQKKDSEETATRAEPRNRGNFYADLDTNEYDCLNAYGILDSGRLHIKAMSVTGDSLFDINLAGTALKSYPIDLNSSTEVLFDKGSNEPYDGRVNPSKGGSITITKFDTLHRVISGNFSFQLRNQYSGETINVTKGIFTDVPYYDTVPLEGPEIFTGLYTSLTDPNFSGVAKFIKNKFTNDIQVGMLASTTWQNGFRGASLNASKSKFVFMELDNTGKLTDIQTDDELSSFSSSDQVFAPQFLNDKIYALVSIGGDLAKVVEFNPITGFSVQNIDTITMTSDRIPSCTDGVNVFYISDDSLFQVTPGTKKTISYRLPVKGVVYMGLDYLSLNTFYTIRHVLDGSTAHNYLELWTTKADKTISSTVIKELQLSALSFNVCTYNRTLNKYYFFDGVSIEEIDIAQRSSTLYPFNGRIGPVRNN